MNVAGKVALVTGAASGLGLETCRTLAAAGARIVAFDRNAELLGQLAGVIPGELVTQVVDVADEASVANGIAAALTAFGRVDIAVSCAGVSNAAKTVAKGTPFPLATWNQVLAVNLTGTFNVIRLAAVEMAKNEPDPETQERGVLINTASGAATQGQIGQAAYSASKAGIVGLTLPVARDLAPLGIRVVTISPGLFETPMVAGLPEKVAQSLVDTMMLFPRRMGRAGEFARLVQHIVENPYLNATTLALDGGARMAGR